MNWWIRVFFYIIQGRLLRDNYCYIFKENWRVLHMCITIKERYKNIEDHRKQITPPILYERSHNYDYVMTTIKNYFSYFLNSNMFLKIEQKGMTFDHDFFYSFSYSSSLFFLGGKRKGEENILSRGQKACLSNRLFLNWILRKYSYKILLVPQKMQNACWYDVNVFKEAKKLYKKLSKNIKAKNPIATIAIME